MPLSYSCWPEARYENGNYVVNIATINEGYDCHFGSDLTAIKILEGNTTLISQNREQVVLDGTESVLVRLFYYVVTDEHGTGYSEIYLIPPLDQDNTAQTNGEEEEEEEEEEDEDQGIAQPIIKFEDDVFEYREDKPNPFPDTDPLRLEGQAAKYLYYRGVIGGYPDGEFKGWKLVNRAEAAKFLINSVGEEIPEGLHNNSRFSDVLDGEWYTRFVLHAVDLGILKGDDHNDTLRPADGVNTVEFLAMLTRAFGLTENMPHNYEDVTSDDWFNKYAGVAKKYDLFPSRGTLLFPGKQLTRDEVSVAIYQLIDNGM